MKTIIYAGDSLTTGDDIAAAVLRCGKALAEDGAAEMVDIPFIDEAGTKRTATLLIGPSSQIVVEDGPAGLDELIDKDAVAVLDRVARQGAAGHAPDDVAEASWVDDL